MSFNSLVTSLSRVALFRGLTREQLERLARAAERAIYPNGQTIVRQGEIANASILIVSGSAIRCDDVVNSASSNGVLCAGALIDDMAMLIDVTANATVVSRETVRALKFPRASIHDQMICDPSLSEHFIEKVRMQLAACSEQLRQSAPEELPVIDLGQYAVN